MINAKKAAAWLRTFADVMEESPVSSWHQQFEIFDWGRKTWNTPGPDALVTKAMHFPEDVRWAPKRVEISGPGGTYS